MASDEEFTSFGGGDFPWGKTKPKNGKLGTVELMEVYIKDIKFTLDTELIKDKYVLMRLKNDIAYKYEQIEAIRKKYPEYFI